MKKCLTIGALVLCLLLVLVPVKAHAAGCESHDYVDGFCTVCGNYKTAPLKDCWGERRRCRT